MKYQEPDILEFVDEVEAEITNSTELFHNKISCLEMLSSTLLLAYEFTTILKLTFEEYNPRISCFHEGFEDLYDSSLCYTDDPCITIELWPSGRYHICLVLECDDESVPTGAIDFSFIDGDECALVRDNDLHKFIRQVQEEIKKIS
jgi:hypothetical protein